MGKQLRIGFAMGGGVSLGTFSGAALSEVVIQALLFGRDDDGNAYDTVVVDVFSGASAGAMSLGVMLRSLACVDVAGTGAAADTRLESRRVAAGLPPWDHESARYKDLQAAQIMQIKQEQVWGQSSINLDLLLATDDADGRKLRHKVSLLNRTAIDDIAANNFSFAGRPTDADGRVELAPRLLGPRVLFACALSNLTGMIADATGEFTDEKGFRKALSDGARSTLHRELRVFDLYFGDTPGHWSDEAANPATFNRYRVVPANPNAADQKRNANKVGDLQKPSAWARMAATAIASGAFPGAFEPVVLERRWWELGYDGADIRKVNLKQTYADGGMFNNEPIREAFRMASLIDGQIQETGDTDNDFDRLIVFVDPYVNPDGPEPASKQGAKVIPAQNLSFHRELGQSKPKMGGWVGDYSVSELCTGERLIPYLGRLLGSLMNEGRAIEGDKIFHTRNAFRLRQETRKHLAAALRTIPDAAAVRSLVESCEQGLTVNVRRETIPTHCIHVAEEMVNVIRAAYRAIRKRKALRRTSWQPDPAPPQDEPAPTSFFTIPETEVTLANATAFLENPEGNLAYALEWYLALSFLAMDLATGLVGKDEAARLVPIVPATRNPVNGEMVLETLPGDRIGAFGGFTSTLPELQEYAMGRYCAARFMDNAGLFYGMQPEVTMPAKSVPFTPEQEIAYEQALSEGAARLLKRVEEVAGDYIGWASKPILAALAGIFGKGIVKALAKRSERSLTAELQIHLLPDHGSIRVGGRTVPAKDLQLRGTWGHDLGPVELAGGWFLVTFLTFYPGRTEGRRFEGDLIDPESEELIIKDRRSGKVVVRVPLPSPGTMNAMVDYSHPVVNCRLNPGEPILWFVFEAASSLETTIEAKLK